TVPKEKLVERVNRNLRWTEGRSGFEEFFVGKEPNPVKTVEWNEADIAFGLFAIEANERERKFTVCSLAMGQFVEELKKKGAKPTDVAGSWEWVERELMRGC